MTDSLVRKVLIASAFLNVCGVLILSRVFTNTTLNEADPVVISNFGLMIILVWGLAYLSAAFINSNIAGIVGVFILVKLIYFLTWSFWIMNNSLSLVYEKDILAGIFYSIYGLTGFAFVILFG